MQTETGAGEAKAGGKKQRVQDEFGGIYELKSKLAEGGQGIVLSTDFQNLLVKVSRWPDGDPRTQAWRKQVEALQRMPVVDEGLPVVMPKARIVKPRAGYVMELVDGLIPLSCSSRSRSSPSPAGWGFRALSHPAVWRGACESWHVLRAFWPNSTGSASRTVTSHRRTCSCPHRMTRARSG